MSELDYLWDKKGSDPEVAELERLLSPLAHRPLPPSLPPRRLARRTWLVGGAVGVAVVALFLLRAPPKPRLVAWPVSVHGQASKDGHTLTGESQLPLGAWLDTGSSHARLQIADIGAVELEPGTLVRIVASGPARHELQLEHGALTATITAAPRIFAVRTKHLVAIDLGCAFGLRVDAGGAGQLAVTAGAVALSDGKHEVAVQAGSQCGFDERGAGTPYFTDATPGFRAAMEERSPTLSVLIREARLKDAAVLRELAQKLPADQRADLLRRASELEKSEPKLEPKADTKLAPKVKVKTKLSPTVAPATVGAPKVDLAPRTVPTAPNTAPDPLHHDARKSLEQSAP